MAAELKKSLGIDAELIRGDGGVFEVRVDGDLVYDKADTYRFPDPGEVTNVIKSRT